MGDESRELRAVGLQEQMIGESMDIGVAQDAALCVKQKAIVCLPFFKPNDGVAHHAVQPADTVAAGNPDEGPIAEVVDSGVAGERVKLYVVGREGSDSVGSAVDIQGKLRRPAEQMRSQRRLLKLIEGRNAGGRQFAHGKGSKKII